MKMSDEEKMFSDFCRGMINRGKEEAEGVDPRAPPSTPPGYDEARELYGRQKFDTIIRYWKSRFENLNSDK